MQNGSTNQVELSRSAVLDTFVPLAPASEQRRIVAKLDALAARVARARAELDRVPVLAKNLRSTALANTYGNLLDEFPAVTVRDLIAGLDQGWSPKCENFRSLDDDTWAVLKTTAIQSLEFRPDENKVLPADLRPRPGLQVEEGDVLVTRAGPRVRCGITCVVGRTRKHLMLADKMYRLRCKPDRARPGYLALILNAPQILAMIEAMKSGISDSGLNLTQAKFLSLPVPSASLETQAIVEANLQTAFARADRLEAEAARARALLDRLESAILANAFRGELVPQNPNDEPASVLLDRVRAERAAAPKAKRNRRAKEGMEA
jgi:type I restriction enzyme S subunit